MATTPALHFPAGMGKRNKINAVCVPEETDGQLEDPISHAQVPPPSATCPADWRLFKKILQESLAASRYRRSAVLDTYKSNDLTRALHYEQSLLHMASHVLSGISLRVASERPKAAFVTCAHWIGDFRVRSSRPWPCIRLSVPMPR